MKTTIEKIPEYMMPYFINGDKSGIEDEDIQNAKDWMEASGVQEVILPSDEDYQLYFTFYPAFGEGCDVVDCECVLEW